MEGNNVSVSSVGFVFSEHYHRDNAGREAAIKGIGGDGNNVIAKFYWNKNHADGAEWHWLTDNGIIIITNALKDGGRRVCTKLIARPQQLLRYRQMGMANELTEKTRKMRNWVVPQRLVGLATARERQGLNYT